MKPRIVCLGHVCIDQNRTERGEYTSWGSAVLYTARHYAAASGIRPAIISTYGADFASYATQFDLLPSSPAPEKTLVFKNIVEAGVRIQYCFNHAGALPPLLTPAVTERLANTDILLIEPLLANYPVDYINEVLSATGASCLKVLCPQGYFRDVNDDGMIEQREFVEAEALLPLFDLVICSEHDLSGRLEAAMAWQRLAPKTHIVVTKGAAGAELITANGRQPKPTKPIPTETVVDSVGSGDTFAAAVAFELFRTGDIHAAIDAGHQAAAQKLLGK